VRTLRRGVSLRFAAFGQELTAAAAFSSCDFNNIVNSRVSTVHVIQPDFHS
jgi:hypothetical protein